MHKTCLAEQWRERIEAFLEGASVGKLQGQTVDVEGRNVVIAMIQSVCLKDYPPEVLQDFGLLIVDEAHHEAAAGFSQAMLKVNCPYVLGLTATPERRDGMNFVNEYFLGEIFFRLQRDSSSDVKVSFVRYDCPAYKLPAPTTKQGKLNLAAFITSLSEDDDRNQLLASLIKQYAGQGRKLLVLSDRRVHCEQLRKMCEVDATCGLYLGSMKQEQLKQAEDCQVLLSTYAMTSEGFDLSALDTLILATPRSDVNQACGRILRMTPGKKHNPVIIDVTDNSGVFYAQSQKRKSFYRSQGFSIASRNEFTLYSFEED